jgi:hypothetical protein
MEHRNRHIFAPFFNDAARRDAAVLVAALPMLRLWQDYWKYCYVWGMGPNLNKIPRHNWHSISSATEQFERLQRLTEFMDRTGFSPIEMPEERPRTHSAVRLLDNPDHLTYWVGPKGEPLVLVEPYTPIRYIEEEIQACGLTAIILPNPGIYGGADGKSTSVFLTTPQYAAVLHSLEGFQFTRPKVTPVPVRWVDALNFSKEGSK